MWAETGILVDGHHRYEICTRLNLPFTVEAISFPDRQSALLFVDQHQAARRNAEENWLAYQRGKQYRAEKKTKAEAGAIGGAASKGNESQEACPCLPTTAEKIAAVSGVSPRTIKNDANYFDAVDALVADSAPMARLLEQKKTAVVKVAKLPEAQRKAVAVALQTEKKIKGAVRVVRIAQEAAAAESASQDVVVSSAEPTPAVVEQAVAAHPDATQQQIAEVVGVNKSTVSRKLRESCAKSEPKLLKHGGNMAEQVGNNQVASKGGMTKPYILARLKRDGHQELAEQVKADCRRSVGQQTDQVDSVRLERPLSWRPPDQNISQFQQRTARYSVARRAIVAMLRQARLNPA